MDQSLWDLNGTTGLSGAWSLFTDRAEMDGTPEDCAAHIFDENGITGRFGGLTAKASFTVSPEKVITRDDTLTNDTDDAITVRRAYSRFVLPCGEYDVYTQANGWQNESEGGWHSLVACDSVENRGLRATQSAAPIMALYNRQTGHGIVFHLFSSCAWKITASVQPVGEETFTMIELGVNEKGLNLTLAPHETIELPRIVYYEFTEKRDLECARLHAWFNRTYPQKRLPLLFNTWMMTFDRIEPEHVKEEVALAARLGADYFVIDAGWFGSDGRWSDNIGAWVENKNGGFYGRMKEVADCVRENGMRFGLWLEIERALPGVPITQEHPDWFFFDGREYFVNFGLDEARKYYTELVVDLAETYGIAFFKFDFNADLSYDPTGCGFLRWNRGHEQFLSDLRKAIPDIYLESCASGGTRLELYNASLFDSTWMSDNHSLYDQTRILRDTMLRVPPCRIEKWPVLKDADGFLDYGVEGTVRRLVACDNATWTKVRGVYEGWLNAFPVGSVMGLSFDMKAVSEETFDFVKALAAAYKRDAALTVNSTMSLLCNTDRVTAWQCTAPSGDIRLCVYAWRHRQPAFTLYPQVESGSYRYGDRILTADELKTRGLVIRLPQTLDADVITLTRV